MSQGGIYCRCELGSPDDVAPPRPSSALLCVETAQAEKGSMEFRATNQNQYAANMKLCLGVRA